jgi:hypothetical protein
MLIATLVKELEWIVVRDNSTAAKYDCWETGSRVIDNSCYTIQSLNSDGESAVLVDAKTVLAFDKYKIDMADVYQNAQECQDKFGFNGSRSPGSFNQDSPSKFNYPECFWGTLPVYNAESIFKFYLPSPTLMPLI